MKRTRNICIILTILAFVVQVPLLLAAQVAKDAAGNSGTLLADLHAKNDLDCAACHGDGKEITVDDNESVVNQNCATCHGTLAELSVKSKEAINPHKSHLGDISCTTCHHGHSPILATMDLFRAT